MRKIYLSAVLGVALLLVMSSFVMAAGKSDVNHLSLYEKNPLTWVIEEDGAWGKMMYKADSFVFNGHGLEANTEYSLINWQGWNNLMVIESGVSNNGGNVNIKGTLNLESFEDDPDDNRDDPEVDGDCRKIWLVPTSEISGNLLNTWNPSSYLFEYNLI
jgi:hypothetical protein